jgi:MinD superfamily P-loop ATPase
MNMTLIVVSGAPGTGKSTAAAAMVAPLGLGAALVDVDTQRPDASARAITAVAAAVSQ